MVLVVGSTGILGSEVVRKARHFGSAVRALARPTASPERLAALRAAGAEIVWGDLKDPASLAQACSGVNAVISTASSTLSRQAGDDIETVDRVGQIALVNAAKSAGVSHFTFFGLGTRYRDSPLVAAKLAFEQAVRASGMQWTSLEGAPFMEVWLSPALGFDYPNKKVAIFGTGDSPISWVSYVDVAEAAAKAPYLLEASNRTFEACGPEALTYHQVIANFENKLGAKFETQQVPASALSAQAGQAEDPLQKSFAALQLDCATGIAMDPKPFATTFALKLTSVDDYIQRVTGT